MKLEIAPRAISEAERCARWWRENRPAAGMLFEKELLDAVDRIRLRRCPATPIWPCQGVSTAEW